ncbi:hypothetical protein FPG101_00865 [Flavobacterium psychrophilum FPG101]|uniref:hypothetical protein n=1 Tax=Flavobacterium psychrophilum TaxID=96345 RepID=UPI0004E7EDB5|nr:hypothetical protein [Flavobacterium psychrophilum]AIJ36654.1 hypothetical protein FPSM_00159 [Flavobacterium psychrophilum]AIN72713.1 hypothetical protein FPG101_00865 [Flavobacterium psychrophilum FPG101]EKT3974853.1 hypothetical protein [Flavobacterium psychrophilum]EKT4537532.1 hypothetical protein [Flavobacterium psychrophilum]EKT4545768.1 hypothetical protein [Flavobacterium psychrophilum]
MIDEIIYTCKEYKERYNEILKQHLTEYADFDEQNFLYSETNKYKVYLSNVTYIRELTIEGVFGNDEIIPINDVQANIWGVDIFDELQQKFKDKNNNFNIEELGKSQFSFDKILCFLGDKIAYLNSEIAIQNVKYDFENVKKQLIKITSTTEKIEYLTGKKFDYLQNKTGIEIENGTTFDKKCELEIYKLNQINSEYPTTTPTDPSTENKTTDQLNKIRNNYYSNYELTLLLKELSNNYEVDLLQSLLTDIEFYLFMEKEEKESNFTHNDIENAIQKLKENNAEIPYYKREKIGELTARQKENRKKAEEKGLSFNPIIDKEQLLYPFEFYNIYTFKNLIKSKLKPQQPEPEPIDLSNTSAVEKIIYLNELGIIDFLRTKPEFMGSTNLMATVLSAITGENLNTLQPILNPMTNESIAQRNNPYKSQKTVNKVRQTLIDKNIKPKTSLN